MRCAAQPRAAPTPAAIPVPCRAVRNVDCGRSGDAALTADRCRRVPGLTTAAHPSQPDRTAYQRSGSVQSCAVVHSAQCTHRFGMRRVHRLQHRQWPCCAARSRSHMDGLWKLDLPEEQNVVYIRGLFHHQDLGRLDVGWNRKLIDLFAFCLSSQPHASTPHRKWWARSAIPADSVAHARLHSRMLGSARRSVA